MSFRNFMLISVAALCGAACPIWAQVPTTPIISITRDYVFPPVGLASTETASITVVNTATAASASVGTTTSSPAPSCTGTISFSNASGAIGTPTSFTVGLEQWKTVTVPFASAGLTGIRGEVQGSVSLVTSTARTPCSLMFSLETYDSTTGATHAVLSNSLTTLGSILPIARVSSASAAR